MRGIREVVSKIRSMQRGSAYRGKLPPGCVLCEKGAKLVLLVTGRCRRRCFYCPLSQAKKGRDVFYANEMRISNVEQAIYEAKLIDALGTGITGGDPLLAIDRTTTAIRALKRRFGTGHQIHLYTSTADSKRIDRLARAGLDEIRFHPPVSMWLRLDRSEFAVAVRIAMKRGLDTGLELPAIPGMERNLAGAVEFADLMGLGFVNLNELEFSETNWQSLRIRGFKVRDDLSAGVEGSEETALAILRDRRSISIHYCSSAFKDGIQLRRRIARRAKNVRKPHELLTQDSTLVKGVIETSRPRQTANMLSRRFDVPEDLMWIDREKKRLEVAPWVLEEIASEMDLPSFIVEEYPTADRLEVERRPLRRR